MDTVCRGGRLCPPKAFPWGRPPLRRDFSPSHALHDSPLFVEGASGADEGDCPYNRCGGEGRTEASAPTSIREHFEKH